MGAGHVVLIALALTILRESEWTLTLKDALFWLVVATVFALRYVDMTRFRGTTAAGEPTTPRHIKRYAAGLLGTALLVWVLAQSLHLP